MHRYIFIIITKLKDLLKWYQDEQTLAYLYLLVLFVISEVLPTFVSSHTYEI